MIRHLGIEHLFDAILVSAESATRKPDARFHREVEEWLSKQDPDLPKVQPHQIAMVGDMLSRDVVGGLRSGWTGTWGVAHTVERGQKRRLRSNQWSSIDSAFSSRDRSGMRRYHAACYLPMTVGHPVKIARLQSQTDLRIS